MDNQVIPNEVIPFSVDSKAAWYSVLKHLVSKDDSPVTVACESRLISAEQVYYPVERLTVHYKAQWNATSIFMDYGTDTETYTEQEIHYFDRDGGEHEHKGYDYFKDGRWHTGHSFVDGSKAGTQAWRPVEVTVTKTREIPWEKENHREERAGTVQDSKLFSLHERYPFFTALFGSYKDGKRNAYSPEEVSGASVDDVILSDSAKKEELIASAKRIAKSNCIHRIPGDKYANFQMDFSCTTDDEVWYYPAYKFTYTCQGKQFDCLVSGCKTDCVYETAYPADSAYSDYFNRANQKLTELNEEKSKATKSLVLSVVAGALVEAIACIMVFVRLIVFLGEHSGFIPLIFWAAVAAGTGYFVYNKYTERKNIISASENINQAKENASQNRKSRKQRIYEIMTDDSLSDEEKMRRCQSI